MFFNVFAFNNDRINAQDKLAKIRPSISMVRDDFVNIEPEEYNSVDEQIISLKAKYSSIRQYNQKNKKNWGFKILVCAGISCFMCDIFVYDKKNSSELDDGKFGHLQKFAQVVAKLCHHLPGHKNYKALFDNWFATLDLLHHLRSKGIHAVGTIRWNSLQGFPLDANKDLMKNGAMDYNCDRNSGIMAVKWVDNSVVNLASNFAGVEPIGELGK